MQILWLRSFIAVAMKKSFSEAANEMFMTQSAISKHIKSIEQAICASLFDRNSRNLKLTQAGESFLGYAIKLLELYDEMLLSVQEFVDNNDQTIRIAQVTPYVAEFQQLISAFRKVNTGMELQLTETSATQALSLLDSAKTDFALVRTDTFCEYNHELIPFAKDEVYVLCSPQHPFAFSKEVSLCDVVREKLIVHPNAIEEFTGIFRNYIRGFKKFSTTVVTSSAKTTYDYIYSNVGICLSITPVANFVLDPDNSLARIPIKEKPYVQSGLLVRSGALNRTCKQLLDFISEKRKNFM